MNGVTDVRYRVVSMLPGMRIIRLFYQMESPFITPAMARDWVAMIFLSLATTRIPTLILFRKMWVCRSTRRTTIICTSSMNTTTSDGLLPTVSNRKERYVFMYSSLTLPNRLIIMKQWSSKRSFVWHRFIR